MRYGAAQKLRERASASKGFWSSLLMFQMEKSVLADGDSLIQCHTRALRQRIASSAAVSSPHHPRHANVHLFLFKEFAAGNLIDSQLDLRVEPTLISEQTVHGFRRQFRGAAAGARG